MLETKLEEQYFGPIGPDLLDRLEELRREQNPRKYDTNREGGFQPLYKEIPQEQPYQPPTDISNIVDHYI